MKKTGILVLALVAVGVGCAPVEPESKLTQMSAGKQEAFTPKADAGVRVNPGVLDLKKEADAKLFAYSADPTGLRPFEKSYDSSQRAANFLASAGGWSGMDYEEKPEPLDEEGLAPLEAQPDRRLAGILIGDTITALLDMGDGTGLKTVRPGQVIEPDKEWMVYSIDEEKAILKRTNNRKRPQFVAVRLGSDLSGGSAGGNAGNAGNAGGRQPGGQGAPGGTSGFGRGGDPGGDPGGGKDN